MVSADHAEDLTVTTSQILPSRRLRHLLAGLSKMSEKLTGGRYNRISPSSGRGSIIAYSPLPKSEQDCLQAPGNNCLAIPLSAIQTAADHGGVHHGPHPANHLAHANSLPVVGGVPGGPGVVGGKLPNVTHTMLAHGDGQKHTANQHHGNGNNNNNGNHSSSDPTTCVPDRAGKIRSRPPSVEIAFAFA
uniref:Uncharacterized protein n=1 Tax=Anopheles atroparvus TaxID=41427 RepID=A0A182JDF9_ANOAO